MSKFILIFFLSCPVLGMDILDAISLVESGGNPKAIGKAKERGLFQFTWVAWEDANRFRVQLAKNDRRTKPLSYDGSAIKIDPRRYSGSKNGLPGYDLAFDPKVSREQAGLFLNLSYARFRARFNRPPTVGELADIFNRGFDGFCRNPKVSYYGRKIDALVNPPKHHEKETTVPVSNFTLPNDKI